MRERQRPNRGAMKKVVVINVIHEAGLRILRAREDVAVSVVAEPDAERVRQEVAEAHGIIVRTFPIDWALIEAAPRLEAVSRHGVGYDNVDVAALDARRVPLTIVGDVNAVPVAEQALFMMLALAKKGAALDRAVRTGEFAKRDSSGTTQGVSTRSVDDLVQAMGMSGVSKSQVSRLCGEIDDKVKRLPRSIAGGRLALICGSTQPM